MMNAFLKNSGLLTQFKLSGILCNGFYSAIFVKTKTIHRLSGTIGLNNSRNRKLHRTSLCSQKQETPKIKTSDKIGTVPNLLSLARIGATPFLSYYIINLDFNLAMGILVAASLTDFIDGWIARSYKNQSSKLGSFLDPLADKLLVITLYGSMAYMNIIPGMLMGLIVFRDIALLSAGVYIRYLSIPPPKTVRKYFDPKYSSAQLSPTLLSKINTAVQLVTAIVSLYGSATSNVPEGFLIYIWYLAGFTTVTSGVSYIFAKNTYKLAKNEKR